MDRRELTLKISIALLILISLLPRKGFLFYPVIGVTVLLAILVRRSAPRLLKKPLFLWSFLLILILMPLISLPKSYYFLGIPISIQGLKNGVSMDARAISMILWLNILANSLTLPELIRFFEKLGMKEIGLKISIAINLLPQLEEEITNTWFAYRLRVNSPFMRALKFPKLLVGIFLQVVRKSEELAIASFLKETRGEEKNER